MNWFLNPISLFGLVFLIVIAALLLHWRRARAVLGEDATEDYAQRLRDRPKTVKDVTEAEFVQLYVAAFEPRWAVYASAALAATLILTPLFVTGLMIAWETVSIAVQAGLLYEPGYYPWMAYIFFSVMALWIGIAAVATRRHHRLRPEPFNAALARARGESLDHIEIPPARPKWARRAVPNVPKPKAEDSKTTLEPQTLEAVDALRVEADFSGRAKGSGRWDGRFELRIAFAGEAGPVEERFLANMGADPAATLGHALVQLQRLEAGERAFFPFFGSYEDWSLNIDAPQDGRSALSFGKSDSREIEDARRAGERPPLQEDSALAGAVAADRIVEAVLEGYLRPLLEASRDKRFADKLKFGAAGEALADWLEERES